jgi:hypothetical protein
MDAQPHIPAASALFAPTVVGTTQLTDQRWLLVVDTDAYAGNFERYMTAYMTGQVGECAVGEEVVAALPEADLTALAWVAEVIGQEVDEHGVHRPVRIEPTPGFFNDGRGQHFRDGEAPPNGLFLDKPWPAYQSVAILFTALPSPEQIRQLQERARTFCARYTRAQSATLGLADVLAPAAPVQILGFRILEEALATRLVASQAA